MEAHSIAVRLPVYGRPGYQAYVLFLLFLVYTLTALDRSVLLVLVEPIKNDLHLTDSQMGIITGPAFSVAFAVFGIPLGILADRSNRRNMIAVCVTLWSFMTAFCGAAAGFFQMVLGRMGVGIGEAGGAPASMAMISDIFPATRRATALSIFYIGGAAGSVMAFGGGAWIAHHYGWRIVFVIAAVPGILLSILIYFTVREPLRGLSDGRHQSSQDVTPVRKVMQFIGTQRSVVHILFGMMLKNAVGNGGMAFFASFMIRSHGMSLVEAGAMISTLYIIFNPVSQLCSGLLTDFLGRRDVRWRIRIATVGVVLALISISSMMIVESKMVMAILFACWSFSTGITLSIPALLQTLVKPQMRATIGSIQFVVASAIGGGLGPLFVGVFSDYLSPQYGVESLRYALLALSFLYAWAAVHFVLSERRLKSDLVRAESN